MPMERGLEPHPSSPVENEDKELLSWCWFVVILGHWGWVWGDPEALRWRKGDDAIVTSSVPSPFGSCFAVSEGQGVAGGSVTGSLSFAGC